jgi:Glycosyl transferase family 2
VDNGVQSVSDFDSTLVETFNYLEGISLDSVRRVLAAAMGFKAADGEIEVLLADVTGDAKIAALLAEFPGVRYLDAVGLGYDEAKARAAEHARDRYVVYLDCDCMPEAEWFNRITAPLRSGEAAAVAGFPRYMGGFLAQLQWLMDFGFLLPRHDREVGCYPSNNSAFIRDLLLRIPQPDGPMRCCCYAHTQLLARMAVPVRLVASAAVTHERPPFVRERLRQGYDMVAACWVEPGLPEARWLRFGIAAAPLYYARRLRLDRRALRHGGEIALGPMQILAAYPLIALARLLDAIGIIGALAFGPAARRLFDRTSLSQPLNATMPAARP